MHFLFSLSECSTGFSTALCTDTMLSNLATIMWLKNSQTSSCAWLLLAKTVRAHNSKTSSCQFYNVVICPTHGNMFMSILFLSSKLFILESLECSWSVLIDATIYQSYKWCIKLWVQCSENEPVQSSWNTCTHLHITSHKVNNRNEYNET